MKKNIIAACAALIVLLALCLAFYPKSEENGALPFADEPVEAQGETEIPFAVPTEETDHADHGAPDENAKNRLKASFDIVRVEEDGSMVAAGKGVAGAAVSLMDGESVLSDFTVNEDGEWVYIPAAPLAAGAHEIWLRDDSMNTRDESEAVIVDVPEPKNAGEALAVIMTPDADEIGVLQAPAPQIKIDVDIRSVKYAQNALTVSGSVGDSGRVNVYTDNLFLGNVWANGEWSLRVPRPFNAGRKYMIRADKVDAKGKVVARVEVPFEIIGGMDKAKRRRVRVVKGDCLWTIAKHLYGSGFAYVTIYQANKRQIKNPDLIYPNQVFVLPAKAEK